MQEREAKTNNFLQRRKLQKSKAAQDKLQQEPVFGRLNQHLATPRRQEVDDAYVVKLLSD